MALPVRRDDESDTARWDPMGELSRLNQHLQRLVDSWGLPSSLSRGFAPLADVEETDEAFLVEIDLAGVHREDVNIELSGRRLVVSVERKERERARILRKRTRTVGRFHYEVVLPGELNDDDVSATLDKGALSVRVAKAASERPRRITVT